MTYFSRALCHKLISRPVAGVFLAWIFMASISLAGPIEDSIVSQLQKQGFRNIEVSRTLLGRSRIVARSNELIREIIVNRTTGEILRDYWQNRGNRSGGQRGIFDPGQYGYDDEDDYDDDRDDDDRDDDDRDDDDRDSDNSGKGSSNSGKGSSNSGSGGGDDDD
jgi:uncharacterized membrane protein YgcG